MLLDCIIPFYIMIIVFFTLVFFSINAEENKRRNSIKSEEERISEQLYSAYGGPGKSGMNCDDSDDSDY
jgi:hypothetical protein